MDLKNTARKFISFPSDSDEEYNGPYVVRPQQLDFLVRVPHTFKDAAGYADELMQGKAVMISFRSVDQETKSRIFDYMEALNCEKNLVLYTPETVEVERQKRKTSLWNR